MKFFAQCCTCLLAIYLGFLAFEPPAAIQVIKHSSYWLLLAATLLLIHASYRVLSESGFRPTLQALKEQRLPLFVIALLSVVFYMLQDDGYKVVMDEPLLAATALHMHHEKEAMTLSRAYNIGGTFNILGGYVDKRPNFYPFLVSMLHDLTGYRAYQGVLLNQLLTPVFLGLLYLIGCRLGGRFAGYCALALASTVPLFAITMNGGGFDLLNGVMILGTLWAAMLYLRKPSDARLNLMLLLVALLANTRYESSLYVFCVIAVVLIAWWREKRIQLTWVSVIVPLLLVYVPLHRVILEQYSALWQLDRSDIETPFSLAFIPGNLESALNFFFTLLPTQPGSALLSGLFCAALLAGIYLLISGRLSSFFGESDAPAVLWFFALMVFNFFLMMAYHWGQADDIAASRIVIPFLIFQILLVVAVIRWLPGSRKFYCLTTIAALLFFIAVTRPENARTDYLMSLVGQKETAWVVKKIRERKGQDTLYITDKHIAVLAEQESSLPPLFALNAKRQLDLHMRLGTFSEVIVLYGMSREVGDFGNWQPTAPIEEHFEIEVLEETKLADTLYARMARVRAVKFLEGDSGPYDKSVLAGLKDEDIKMNIFAKTLP